MILEDDKKADKPKSFVGDPTKVNAACELSLANIFKQMHEKAKDLAGRLIKNFAKYEGNEAGKALVAAGPQL